MDEQDIAIDLSPDPRDRAALLQLLAASNGALAGPSGYRELAFLIRNGRSARVEGGLWASTVYRWLYIEFLFVPPTMRKKGVGSRLLRMAEEGAVRYGCRGIHLASYAFQAPGFYEKNGFALMGTLPGEAFRDGSTTADTSLNFYTKSLAVG